MTDHREGDEIANAAAGALHGDGAREERYEQGGATELIGGTLIGDEPASPENHIGERRVTTAPPRDEQDVQASDNGSQSQDNIGE